MTVMLAPVAVATLAIGIVFLIRLSRPASNTWTQTSVAFTLPYHVITLSADILVTVLISIRILCMRRQV